MVLAIGGMVATGRENVFRVSRSMRKGIQAERRRYRTLAKEPQCAAIHGPVSGEQHGYHDGWQPDGHFHYTGEGQRGGLALISGRTGRS
jgi:hypothetical protein